MTNFYSVINENFTINEALRCERLLRDLVSLSMNDDLAFERPVKDREVLIKPLNYVTMLVLSQEHKTNQAKVAGLTDDTLRIYRQKSVNSS